MDKLIETYHKVANYLTLLTYSKEEKIQYYRGLSDEWYTRFNNAVEKEDAWECVYYGEMFLTSMSNLKKYVEIPLEDVLIVPVEKVISDIKAEFPESGKPP